MIPVMTPQRTQEVARLIRAEGVAEVLIQIDPDDWDGDISGDPDLHPQISEAERASLLEKFEGYSAWRLTEKGRELRSKIIRLGWLTK